MVYAINFFKDLVALTETIRVPFVPLLCAVFIFAFLLKEQVFIDKLIFYGTSVYLEKIAHVFVLLWLIVHDQQCTPGHGFHLTMGCNQ